ncbi:Nuclear control of ATPase 2-like protein [Cladobotryum mycophilum]|uniref:Nuclear control of ATPase 2-like protein n=1 Tax=Cladobotryum mycophilum TaxID=491253 RepID=A0ABR0T1V3_9HYPO
MSLVANQVRRLDAYLDRLPILEEGSDDGVSEAESRSFAVAEAFEAPRLDNLLRIVRSLSTTSSSQPLLSTQRIKALLHESGLPSSSKQGVDGTLDGAFIEAKSPYETEVEWLLVTKASVQVYGVILNTLLERIIPLSDDILYWDEVLSSYTYSSLYTVQTSPVRLWVWSQDIYHTTRLRFQSRSMRDAHAEFVESTQAGISQQWRQLYGIVQDTIRERSFANIQQKVLSPVAFCKSEARRKQAQLRKLREITASGLGVLIDEGLQLHDDEKIETLDHSNVKGVVERSVALMDTVLKEVCTLEASIHEFENKVFAGAAEDPELSIKTEEGTAPPERPATLARRLLGIIDEALPKHVNAMQSLANANGQPHVLVRYWLPAVIGLTSSTTIFRILVNRRADIIDWITNFGRTLRAFWLNWVVEPTEKIIKTIRHDAKSEIAIMSRDSLKADRESLERMVVDFAMDKPHFAVGGTSISDIQIAEIRSKVAEGDVTPVLRAYEQDLRKPFFGAVRGDLVRSLLIQVQKTKVDLEVAMTGIDSLLKSQELVFGFVGLTPGVFVSIGIMQYLRGIFGGRSGQRHRNDAGQAIRILRNIDRILSEARPKENDVLSYKDHGLLLCEVHVLRSMASRLMPHHIKKEFLEDLDDLANTKGIRIQAKALDRVRWAYAQWLS